MNFLYPQFLFGLFALAIPIIIHLFNFRKTKRVYFSNNQFLKNIKEVSSAKLKLKHLLVLAARLLFIFFLVITFAQPIIPSESGNGINSNVHIYLDNSMSMSNETGTDLRAFDQAINYVNEILTLYPPNTRYKLLTNDFHPFSNQYKSSDDVRERTTELDLSPISRELTDVFSRLTTANEPQEEARDIYLISDFQRATSPVLKNLETDSSDNIYLVPLQHRSMANVFIDSVFLANPFLIADNVNEVGVVLRNTGDKDVEDIILKMFIDNAQVASTSIDIKAHTDNSASFKLNFDLNKINRCRISFEEFPVSYDNDFYFTLNIGGKINILEIRDQQASESIEKVYGNKDLFNFSSYNSSNLDYNQLRSADLVILHELSGIDASFLPYLKDFINNGGNIMIIFPANPDLSSYQQLVPRSLSAGDRTKKVALERLDMKNPFFSNIFEVSDEAILMPAARNSVEWAASGNTLLSYKNNTPFLSVFGRDNLYLLGAPLKEDFSNFQTQAIFVPIMYRIAALSKSLTDKFYYTMDETVMVLDMDMETPKNRFKLNNGKEEIIPGQRLEGGKLTLEVPKNTLDPGFYELSLNDTVLDVLAFNYNKKESIFDQYPEEELVAAFDDRENVNIYKFDDAKTFRAEVSRNHTGDILWKYTLILALLFLLAEVLLIRLL